MASSKMTKWEKIQNNSQKARCRLGKSRMSCNGAPNVQSIKGSAQQMDTHVEIAAL